MSEDEIQAHVVKFLEQCAIPDLPWFAVPNGEKRNIMVGLKLKNLGVRRGVPDIILLIDQTFHGLELKTEKGRLSVDQENFKRMIENQGGYYHVARSLEQAVWILREIGAFRLNIKFNFHSLPPGRWQDTSKQSRPRKQT